MSIQISRDASGLVSLRSSGILQWIGTDGVLDQRGAGTGDPSRRLQVGDHLPLGSEVWTVRPDSRELVVLVFDASGVRLRTPSPVELPPPMDNSDVPFMLAPVDADTSDFPDLVAEHVAQTFPKTPEAMRAALVDQGPIVAGLTQFSMLRDLLEASLDLMSAEADMLCDAADLAVDQVQDMRIAWLEEGPEVEFSDLLLNAVLTSVVGHVGAKVAGSLMNRGLKSWSRMKRHREIRGQRGDRDGRKRALEELRDRRASVSGRLEHAGLTGQEAFAEKVDMSIIPLQNRSPEIQGGFRDNKMRPYNHRVGELERQAGVLDKSIAEVESELSATRNALKSLGRKSGKVTNEALKEMIVASRAADAASMFGDALAHATDGALMPRARQPSRPIMKTSLAGSGPSALIRIQVLELRRSQQAEIGRIRREAARLGELVNASPQLALAPAIEVVRETVAHLAEPALTHADYRSAVLELALELELAIWSLVFDMFLDRRRFRDMLSLSGPDVPGFELYVRGASKRAVRYMVERFRPIYGDIPGSDDISRLISVLNDRRVVVQQEHTHLLSALQRDPEPLVTLRWRGVARQENAEEDAEASESPVA